MPSLDITGLLDSGGDPLGFSKEPGLVRGLDGIRIINGIGHCPGCCGVGLAGLKFGKGISAASSGVDGLAEYSLVLRSAISSDVILADWIF